MHAYLFMQPGYHRLSDMVHVSPVPKGSVTPNVGHNPLILNEYGMAGTQPGRFLHHDEQGGVRKPLGQEFHCAATATSLCALSGGRDGVLAIAPHVCRGDALLRPRRFPPGRGNQRPFRDVQTLTLDPEFESRLRDAFAPVGLMLDFWDDKRAAGKPCDFPVAVVNDLDRDWSGSVRLQLRRDGQPIADESLPCQVKALGSAGRFLPWSCRADRAGAKSKPH